MLKQVKETNEKAIKNYFSQSFGKDYEVEVNWGYPTTTIGLTNKRENGQTSWNISVNLENDDYQVSTRAVEIKDEKEIAAWATIDNKTINFIVEGTKYVINELFKTPEDKKENNEDVEKVDAEQVE